AMLVTGATVRVVSEAYLGRTPRLRLLRRRRGGGARVSRLGRGSVAPVLGSHRGIQREGAGAVAGVGVPDSRGFPRGRPARWRSRGAGRRVRAGRRGAHGVRVAVRLSGDLLRVHTLLLRPPGAQGRIRLGNPSQAAGTGGRSLAAPSVGRGRHVRSRSRSPETRPTIHSRGTCSPSARRWPRAIPRWRRRSQGA